MNRIHWRLFKIKYLPLHNIKFIEWAVIAFNDAMAIAEGTEKDIPGLSLIPKSYH